MRELAKQLRYSVEGKERKPPLEIKLGGCGLPVQLSSLRKWTVIVLAAYVPSYDVMSAEHS